MKLGYKYLKEIETLSYKRNYFNFKAPKFE